jgi:hypothetical protein
MWVLEPNVVYEIRLKQYQKKHRRELLAVLDNLDTFFRALKAGMKPLQAKAAFGFTHRESSGAVAIDQKGGGPHLAETRLYLFADDTREVVHLITLGDKNSQADDNKHCAEFIKELRTASERYHGQEIRQRSSDGA